MNGPNLADCAALLAGAAPRKVLECGLRFAGVAWANDSLALGYEFWYESRQELWYTFDPSWGTRPGEEGLPPRRVLFDRNSDDAYTDPGSPMTVRNKWGNQVMAVFDAGSIEGLGGRRGGVLRIRKPRASASAFAPTEKKSSSGGACDPSLPFCRASLVSLVASFASAAENSSGTW